MDIAHMEEKQEDLKLVIHTEGEEGGVSGAER